MLELLDQTLLLDSTKLFLQIMLVFAFCLSIFLLLGPSMFTKVSQRLQTECGLKKELVPWFEGNRMFIDQLLFNRRKVVSILVIIFSLIGFIILQ